MNNGNCTKLMLTVWISYDKMGQTGYYPQSSRYRILSSIGDLFRSAHVSFDNGILTDEDLDLLVERICEALEKFAVLVDVILVPIRNGGYSAGYHWSNVFENVRFLKGLAYRPPTFHVTHEYDSVDRQAIRAQLIEALPNLKEANDDIAWVCKAFCVNEFCG